MPVDLGISPDEAERAFNEDRAARRIRPPARPPVEPASDSTAMFDAHRGTVVPILLDAAPMLLRRCNTAVFALPAVDVQPWPTNGIVVRSTRLEVSVAYDVLDDGQIIDMTVRGWVYGHELDTTGRPKDYRGERKHSLPAQIVAALVADLAPDALAGQDPTEVAARTLAARVAAGTWNLRGSSHRAKRPRTT